MNSQPAESAESNPAVSRCWGAAKTAYRASLADGKEVDSARYSASKAYRAALPPLKGVRNIRNFIACVTFADLMDLIDGRESSRLLYAARIAYATRRTRKREAKPAESSENLSHSGAIQSGVSAIQEPSSEPAQAV